MDSVKAVGDTVAMPDETLQLSNHETVRVVRKTADELELEATWGPGGSPPLPHLHPAQDEWFEVRTGRLTANVDGAQRELRPGDTLHVAPRTPHRMWNQGAETATALWRTRPPGRTCEWFRTVDRLVAGGTRKPPVSAMAKAVTEYSDVFRLAIGPTPLRPVVDLALRALALGWR